jgi:hypothetical protein
MNFLDVARYCGQEPLSADPGEIAKLIVIEQSAGGGLFNYNPAISTLPELFAGAMTADAAVEHCRTTGVPAGRRHNVCVAEMAAPYALENRSNVYRIPNTAVSIGRLRGGKTAYMAIKAPLIRVANGQPFVVVPNFRAGHRPVGGEIDTAASLALAAFARDGAEQADFEYIDCGRGVSGERELHVHWGCNRRRYSLDEVDNILERFVAGLQLAVDQGLKPAAPNFRGYRVEDPSQPRMF